MSARHSANHIGRQQRQRLELEIKADMPNSIAGYQLELIYNPGLLAVVGFEKGDLLGKGSFHLDPQMTLGRIGKIAATQLGDSVGEGVAQSTMASVSFRLKGDLSLALKSIGIRDLVIINQQLQSILFELDPSLAIDQGSVLLSSSCSG